MSKMTNKKLALLALAGLGAVASGPAFAGGMTVDTKGGIEVFELDENNFWFKLSGRLFLDQVWYDNEDDNVADINFPSGAHIRSARLTLKGGVGGDWVYKWDIDVQDNPGSVGVNFGEAFIGYSGCKDLWFALGQISVPFGLENWASFSDLTFMEPSLATSAFAPNRGLGIYAEWHGHMFTAAAALYHEAAGYIATGDVLSQPALFAGPGSAPIAGTGPLDSDAGSDDLGFGARVTFSPVHDDFTVYHAGISARWEDFHDHANNFNYWAGMELQARQTPWAITNIPPNSTDSHNVWGFELAGRWGPALIQGEYMIAEVNRDDEFGPFDLRNPPGDLDYHGYYIAASYVLTGEARQYDFDSGTFGSVHPSCSKGAWEIGIRFSFVDLLDNEGLNNNNFFQFIDFVPSNAVDVFDVPVVAGNNFRTGISSNEFVGDVHSTTIGLTWYVNDNVRFMANYVHIDLPGSEDVDGLGLRGQVTW